MNKGGRITGEFIADEKAVWQMDRIRSFDPAFVGIEDVCRGSFPAYAANADKISGPALWVASVLTLPEDPHLVKERVNKRVQRLIKSGVKVECVLVPCDDATIIISTADLVVPAVCCAALPQPYSGLDRRERPGLVDKWLDRTEAPEEGVGPLGTHGHDHQNGLPHPAE